MTEQEKATQLMEVFHPYAHCGNNDDWEAEKINTKIIAMLCIDELIKEHTWSSPIRWNLQRKEYWEAVKIEIEKL